jgi:hypothetical protein
MNDDLCNLHPLAAERRGEQVSEVRLCDLPSPTALHVLRPGALLSKAPTSSTRDSRKEAAVTKQMIETTVQLKITHDKPLPDLLISVLEQRAYDYCAARSVRADVDGKVWYELKVRDAQN